MAETKDKAKPKADETDTKAGGTELATRQESTDLAAADDDFFADAGAGLSDFQQTDFLIPYVRIIQALSKELQRNHAKFLEGAQQGMFVNSATRKTYSGEKGFLAVPVGFSHRYMAWRPNNAGPAYDMGDDPSVYNSITPLPEGDKNAGKRFDQQGNEVTDSLQYFILLVNPETQEWEAAVLNFSGVQARKGRGWATTINNRMERHPQTQQLFRPAMWFYSYKITTVPESNDKGSWYGFLIEEGPKVKDLPNGKEIFRAASELRKRVDAGEVKGAVDDERDDANPGEEKAF
jgi:hypothetical protein